MDYSLLEYIYIENNVLSEEECNDIINQFEKSKFYSGVIGQGLYKNIKNTNDFHMSNDTDSFKEIDNILYKKLHDHLTSYLNKINKKCITILMSDMVDSGFNIQKYTKNEGFYQYHNDSGYSINLKKSRFLTYLFYLNNVDEGGETEFFGSYKVKPETGKLIIFPACWTYPHCGLQPVSHDKYIVTGWIYQSNNF